MTTVPGIYLVPRDPVRLNGARNGRSYGAIAAAARCSTSFFWGLCHGVNARVSAELAGRIEDVLEAGRGSLFMLAEADAALLLPYSTGEANTP